MTWVVAEGRRGRRWREVVTGPHGLRHSLLLETAPDGSFLHLELATPAGLLTLHPEGDRTLHGNAAGSGGVDHIVGLPWDDTSFVLIEGSPVSRAAITHRLRHVVAPGASAERTILRIDADLGLVAGRGRIARPEADTWQIDAGTRFPADPDGLPVLGGGATWPLELAE